MMIYYGLRSSYQLESTPIASGGEGDVYRVQGGTGGMVAKIYHGDKLTYELEEKLRYMMDYPPDASVLYQVAWPLDVLYNDNERNKFCGFVMPELPVDMDLKDIYQYPLTIALSSSQKIIIAENICAVISAVHNAGYVFGDFNPQNIGVQTGTGMVAFFDTDSYHILDKSTDKLYRCKVCADGYVAPELLEICLRHTKAHPDDQKRMYEKAPLPTFTKETDNFALAIHIFKLLMNGFTPFGGIIEDITPSRSSPSRGNMAIIRNEYCFRPGYKPLSAAVPPLDVFPQEIADLFMRAFLVIGKVNPSQRPDSVEWHRELSQYEKTLITCSKNKLHQYGVQNQICPFCEADQRYQEMINGETNEQEVKPIQVPVSLIQQKTYSDAPQVLQKSVQTPEVAVSYENSIHSKYDTKSNDNSLLNCRNSLWQKLLVKKKIAMIVTALSSFAKEEFSFAKEEFKRLKIHLTDNDYIRTRARMSTYTDNLNRQNTQKFERSRNYMSDNRVTNNDAVDKNSTHYAPGSFIEHLHSFGGSTLFLMGIILLSVGHLLNLNHIYNYFYSPIRSYFLLIKIIYSFLPIIAFGLIFFASKKPKRPERVIYSLKLLKVIAIFDLIVKLLLESILILGTIYTFVDISDHELGLIRFLETGVTVMFTIIYFKSIIRILNGIKKSIFHNNFKKLSSIGLFTKLKCIGVGFSILIALLPVWDFDAMFSFSGIYYALNEIPLFSFIIQYFYMFSIFPILLVGTGTILCIIVLNRFNDSLK